MQDLSDTTNWIKVNKKLPIKLHKKLIDESLVILIFSVNICATNTSKKVEILHKYDYRCLEMKLYYLEKKSTHNNLSYNLEIRELIFMEQKRAVLL